MSRIFISHSSLNNAHALAISRWLTDNGWDEHFLDLEPTRGLTPGQRWQDALRAAAGRCEAVLFLISPAWRESRWCLAEFLLATQLGKTVFGLLVEPVPLDTLPAEITNEWQLCDLVTGAKRNVFRVFRDQIVPETDVSFAASGLDRLKQGLTRAGLDPASFPWPPAADAERRPYPGLRALECEDAAVFFGRDSAIVRGLDTLRVMRERGIERIFVILGASGAGKSSFLRAGLLPRLKRDDRRFLPLPVIRPGRAVLSGATGLIVSLEQAFRELGSSKPRGQIRQVLQKSGALNQVLDEICALHCARLGPHNGEITLLLCVDQGEELFSTEDRAEALEFLAALSQALARPADAERLSTPRARVTSLIAIRTEAYERLQTEPNLQGFATLLFSLPPMEHSEFKGVIEGPAARATAGGHPLKVEPGLSERLTRDAQGADALPLLAFTLERLYAEYGSEGRLRAEDYEALGGVRGSIEAAIDAAFLDPDHPPAVPGRKEDRELLLRKAFVPWLARIDPDTDERRRRLARWDEIPDEAHGVLERLIRQRLIMRDRRRFEDTGAEVTVVEVAHEALLRQWSPLTTWLDADADALKTVEAVRRAAAEWERNGQGAAWLVHGGDRLTAGEQLRLRSDFEQLLGAEGNSYLRACRDREEAARADREAQLRRIAYEQARVREEQARTDRAQRRILALIFFLALALLGGAVWVLAENREVHRQYSLVLASSAARANDDGNYLSGMKLALLAARNSWLSPAVPEAEAELARAAQSSMMVAEMTHSGIVNAAVFSPDGQRVLTTSEDGMAQIWDARTGQTIVAVKLGDAASGSAFSPDGRKVVSVFGMNTTKVRIWDAETGRSLIETEDESGARSAAFSSDGRFIVVTQSFGRKVWVRNAETLTVVTEAVFGGAMNSAALSPDGRLMVAVSDDQTARVWEAATGRRLTEVKHEKRILSASFSPDGHRVVTASDDGTARIWDAVSGRTMVETKHPYRVRSVSFSPDGRQVLTAAEGGDVVRIWDSSSGRTISELKYGSGMMSAVFSPDGKRVLAATFDGRARVSDAATGATILEVKQEDLVRTALFSPDGRQFVTACDSGRVRVWESEPYRSFGEHSAYSFIRTVSWSPEGRSIATAADDRTVRLWDADTGKQLWESRDNRIVLSAVFSRDGRRVLMTSGIEGQKPGESGTSTEQVNQAVRVLEARSGRILAETNPATGSINVAEISPDAKSVLLADAGGTLRLWKTDSGKTIWEIKNDEDSVTSAAFTPDGQRLIITWNNGNAEVLEPQTGKTLLRVKHNDDDISAAVSPDGRRVVTGSGDTVRLWDVATGKNLAEMKQPAAVSSVSFSSDGKRVVCGTYDGVGRVWSDKGTFIAATRADHSGSILSVVFSPDGRRVLMTCGANGCRTARIWDAISGKTLIDVRLDGLITAAAFRPDGQRLAIGSSDGIVRLFDTSWTTRYGSELTTAVCSQKLNGAKALTFSDVIIAPALRGRESENVCGSLR